jgi:hypothetical protein
LHPPLQPFCGMSPCPPPSSADQVESVSECGCPGTLAMGALPHPTQNQRHNLQPCTRFYRHCPDHTSDQRRRPFCAAYQGDGQVCFRKLKSLRDSGPSSTLCISAVCRSPARAEEAVSFDVDPMCTAPEGQSSLPGCFRRTHKDWGCHTAIPDRSGLRLGTFPSFDRSIWRDSNIGQFRCPIREMGSNRRSGPRPS